MISDDQIKEVMRLADVIENLAWSAGKTEQYHDEPTDYAEKLPAARAELEAYLRTIGEPVGYSLPAGSMGAKKFAQVGGGFTPVGLVFSRGESAMAITEHGRVYWDRDLVHPISGEPEQSVNAELLEALKGMVDAHAIPSSYCKERSVYDQARAAIARAESAIESSPKPVTFPAMKAAFRTTRVEAGEFIMAFKFRDIEDMDRADDEWRAAMAIETPAKVSPCAGHAVQQDADASRDWPEDFPHENGQYMNTCHVCKNTFIGHKHRVVCKVCKVRNNGFIRAQQEADEAGGA